MPTYHPGSRDFSILIFCIAIASGSSVQAGTTRYFSDTSSYAYALLTNVFGAGSIGSPHYGSLDWFMKNMTAEGDTIVLNAGTFYTAGCIDVPDTGNEWALKKGQILKGQGMASTTVKVYSTNNNTTGPLHAIRGAISTSSTDSGDCIQVRDLKVDCSSGGLTSSSYARHGVNLYGRRCSISKVHSVSTYGKWSTKESFPLSIGRAYGSGIPTLEMVGSITECTVDVTEGDYASAIQVEAGLMAYNTVTFYDSDFSSDPRFHGINIGGDGGSDCVTATFNTINNARNGVYLDTGAAYGSTIVNNTFVNAVNGFNFNGSASVDLSRCLFALNEVQLTDQLSAGSSVQGVILDAYSGGGGTGDGISILSNAFELANNAKVYSTKRAINMAAVNIGDVVSVRCVDNYFATQTGGSVQFTYRNVSGKVGVAGWSFAANGSAIPWLTPTTDWLP